MPPAPNRRDLMRTLAGAGLAGLSLPGRSAAEAPPRQPVATASPNKIRAYRTFADQRHALDESLRWESTAATGPNLIRLDPASIYQEILGFGASLTDAACFVINQLEPSARTQLLRELFHPSESAFGVARVCLGSSDYATKAYTYDDGEPDPELTRFSLEHDQQSILPVLRECRSLNPELFLLGSPWSPPGWMKTNGSIRGGAMRREFLAPYARYFVKFLEGYSAAGVPVNAITTQNEVDTDQQGRMPACLWSQDLECEFIANHLGPLLNQNQLATKIWILDHNYNLWQRAIATLDQPAVAKHVDGVAWHAYAGTPDLMTRVHDAHPAKHAYWTEGGPNWRDRQYLTDWARWSATFTGILRHWSRCIIGWNLALDEQGRPNIGPFHCGGILSIHSTTREITRSGMYWALAHFSRGIRRGARRFGSEGNVPGVSHVAFTNPDGSHTVLLTNTANEQTVHLALAGHTATIPLPKDSVTTVSWT